MGRRFCVRGPDGLWFSWRDADADVDVWTSSICRACSFENDRDAMEMAIALCARNGGDFYLVYEVDVTRRRIGRRF